MILRIIIYKFNIYTSWNWKCGIFALSCWCIRNCMSDSSEQVIFFIQNNKSTIIVQSTFYVVLCLIYTYWDTSHSGISCFINSWNPEIRMNTLYIFYTVFHTFSILFLACNHMARWPCWWSIQQNFFSKNLHENRV